MANKKISQLTAVTTPLTGTEELPAVQSTVTKKVTVIELQAAPVSAGSANAVQYLNASKVPSTSTAFTFDGSSVSAPTTIVNSGFTGGRYEINFSSSAAASRTWKLQTDYSAFGALSIVTAATQGGAVTKEIVQFDSSGNANLYLGNLVIGTAGKGIDFSANGGDVLTQYDEGDWTPNQGAGLTVVGAFSSSGKYTRTGRQVTVTGQVNGATSVLVSASGVISTNLPFTSGVNTLGVATNSALSVVGGVFVSSGTTNLSATVAIGATSTIYFQATYFV